MKTALLFVLFCLFSMGVEATSISVPIRVDGTTCTTFTPTVSEGVSVLTCGSGPAPPGAPTNCIATVNGGAAASFTNAGGTAGLSVTCDPLTGITYNWSKNGVLGANTNRQWSEVLPANSTLSPVITSYQVRPCNGTACVTVPATPLTATVAASGGWSGTCPGFTNTYVVTMPWTNSTRVIQPMTSTDMLVVRFTAGSTTRLTNFPHIAVVEYNSPPSSRLGTLSSTPCDFSTQPAFSANIGPSNSISVYFGVGVTEGVYLDYYAVLQANKTYYLNIKNVPGSSCSVQDICQVAIDLINPGNIP